MDLFSIGYICIHNDNNDNVMLIIIYSLVSLIIMNI